MRLVVLAALLLAAAPAAHASRPATPKEAAAIERAFFKTHPEDATTIDSIRVSTKDKRFAAVRYSLELPDRAAVKAPAPVFTKKAKVVAPKKLPKKVGKDLGRKAPDSLIRITGAYTATLTGPARCTRSGDFYTASLYDRARDIYFDLDSFEFTGSGVYALRQVWSIAGLAIGNNATSHTYETTWGEPDVPKGYAFISVEGRSGVLSATMGPQPPPEEDDPSTFVEVEGHWACP